MNKLLRKIINNFCKIMQGKLNNNAKEESANAVVLLSNNSQ